MKAIEEQSSLSWFDLLWIPIICDKNCSVVIDMSKLTLEQLLKINEYRDIQASLEEAEYADHDDKMKANQMKR